MTLRQLSLSKPTFFICLLLFSAGLLDMSISGASVDTLVLPTYISSDNTASLLRHPSVHESALRQSVDIVAKNHSHSILAHSSLSPTMISYKGLPLISSSESDVTLRPDHQPSDHFKEQAKPPCASCAKNAQSRAESQTNLRLELIKRQILKKLGLTKPPSTIDLPLPENDELPLPLVQDGFLFDSFANQQVHTNDGNKNVEEFYSKTEQVVFFPKEDTRNCMVHPTDSSLCFHFEISANYYRNSITEGELWVYKGIDHVDLWAEEVAILADGYKFERLEIVQNAPGSPGGWVKFRMSNVLRRWMLNPSESSHIIRLGCTNCESWERLSEFPVPQTGDHRPFIAAQLESQPKKKRSRRSLNCTPNIQECCREPFVVSFKDIGWSSWIIRPEKYDAYLCKGSCLTLSAMAHSSTRHASVMQKYLRTFGTSNRSQDIVPCCSASRLSPLSLLYRDPNDLNHTIKFETLPNMIVESCGCL